MDQKLPVYIHFDYILTLYHTYFVIDTAKPVFRDSVLKLESTITQIYNYLEKSTKHQLKLKSWQAFMEMVGLKFKKIFDVRWLSLRGCVKPIANNVQLGF